MAVIIGSDILQFKLTMVKDIKNLHSFKAYTEIPFYFLLCGRVYMVEVWL